MVIFSSTVATWTTIATTSTTIPCSCTTIADSMRYYQPTKLTARSIPTKDSPMADCSLPQKPQPKGCAKCSMLSTAIFAHKAFTKLFTKLFRGTIFSNPQTRISTPSSTCVMLNSACAILLAWSVRSAIYDGKKTVNIAPIKLGDKASA